MNRCWFCGLATLVVVGLLLGGCGTTGPSVRTYDPSKPRTLLAGAEVQHARSIAMGSAASKGWRIVDSSENRLLARRPLNAATAEPLVGEPVSTASVEVATDFYQRQEGVEVVIGAALITNMGEESERRLDFTESYRNELNYSLNSLSRAWQGNRQRVATATPPLPTQAAAMADGDTQTVPTAVEVEGIAGPADQAAPRDSDDRDWSESPADVGAPVAVSSAGAPSPSGADGYGAAAQPSPPPSSASESTGAAGSANSMLVLNRSSDPGVWAYYAEHYAKIRGCEVSDSGAVLEEKRPEHEIHRVYCDNGQSFLVSCNAGTCRGIQ